MLLLPYILPSRPVRIKPPHTGLPRSKMISEPGGTMAPSNLLSQLVNTVDQKSEENTPARLSPYYAKSNTCRGLGTPCSPTLTATAVGWRPRSWIGSRQSLGPVVIAEQLSVGRARQTHRKWKCDRRPECPGLVVPSGLVKDMGHRA